MAERLELPRLEQGAQPLPALAPPPTLVAQPRHLRLRRRRRRRGRRRRRCLRDEHALAPRGLRSECVQLRDLQLELVPRGVRQP